MLLELFSKHALDISCVPGLWTQLKIRTSSCIREKYRSSAWESLDMQREPSLILTAPFPRFNLPLPYPFSCTSCVLILLKAQKYPSSRKSSQIVFSNSISPFSHSVSTWGPNFHATYLFALVNFLVCSHFSGEQLKAPGHWVRKWKITLLSPSQDPSGNVGQSSTWPPGSSSRAQV